MKQVRVLDGVLYDTLHLAALANGGIGAYRDFADKKGQCPVCAHGLVVFAQGKGKGPEEPGILCHLLYDCNIQRGTNDAAILAINARKGNDINDWANDVPAKVTFEEWCAELNVVRAED